MSGEGISRGNESKEKPADVPNPYAEAFLASFHKEFAEEPELESLEGRVREIIDTFFEKEIANTELHRSPESGAAFPVTSISLSELAHALYTGTPKAIAGAQERARHVKRKYVFGSAVNIEGGRALEFAEIALHEMVKKLPAALERLRHGEEPEDYQVTTLGYPTNTAGIVTPEYAEEVKGDPFDALASLYAEHIEQELGAIPVGTPTDIELHGISMGAGVAARTAERLLEMKREDGSPLATQEGNTQIPRIAVRAEVPVALGTSRMKIIQIPAGFVLDGLTQSWMRPYVGHLQKNLHDFTEGVNDKLQKEKGIARQLSAEQVQMKNQAIRSTIFALTKGITLKPETKITEVYGLKDLTTITPEMLDEASLIEEEEGLGRNLLSRKKENARRFAIDMMHTQPFNRPNELNRLKVAAESLTAARVE